MAEPVKIPLEFYAIVGFLVVSNLGALLAVVRAYVKRETEWVLVQNSLNLINTQLTELKGLQEKNKKDINEAHTQIRELKVLLRNM